MKHSKRWIIFLVCISFFTSIPGIAQSTIGNEFLVGFMENNQKPNLPDKAVVVITANENVSGTIDFLGQQLSFSLSKGQIFKKEFFSVSQDVIHRKSEEKENKSILIKTSGMVSVYAYNTRQNSADATLVLPVNILSKDYFVTAHFRPLSDGPDNSASTALVLANEDNTLIEITPSVATELGKPAKQPFTITLNAGESYQIRALGDLTGTRFRILNSDAGDCKKLAVFGGNKMTTVAECGDTGDHMYYQSLPMEFWGKSYIHVPLKNRTSGEVVKVLAGTDNTEVKVNGISKGFLNQGEFMRMEFKVDEVATIETSQPAAVSLLSKSQDCNTSPGFIGDPFLINLQHNELRIKELDFYSVDESGFIFNNANIIAPTATLSQIRLNGLSITSQFKPVPGNAGFSYAQVNLIDGANRFFSPEGAIIYVYGAGQRSSYGYSAGFESKSSELKLENEDAAEVDGKYQVCLNQESTWKVNIENPLFTVFTWDFGDGSGLKNGKSVSHKFSESGNFMVKVMASTGTGTCALVKALEFEVLVKDIEGQISGPSSACEGTQSTYQMKNGESQVKATWIEVIGGEIVSQDENQLQVKWNEGVELGKIKAAPVSAGGCQGKEVEFVVQLGIGEELPFPVGPAQFCAGQLTNYEIPQGITGESIEWLVQGGQIKDGQGSSKVSIQWNPELPNHSIVYTLKKSGSGCILFSKELKTIQSDDLEILVQENLSPQCPGESSGHLEIKILGGSGNYDIIWSHATDLKSTKAENLPAGKYFIKVRDREGCASAELEVEVKDPLKMRLLGEVETFPIVCQGASTGKFRLKIEGGTPPYRIDGLESNWDGQFLEVLGLSKGSFNLFVSDSKGCTLPVSGQIQELAPMTVAFVENNQGCPGGNTGELSVKVSGGAPPYRYSWNLSGGIGIAATSTTPRSFLDQGPSISSMPSGQYEVMITDTNGCTVRAMGMISETKPELRMPTGFKPADGLFEPVSNCGVNFQIQVFDRWGNVAYSGSQGWNGEIKGKEAPTGTYHYRLVYFYTLSGQEMAEENQGSFILLR